MDAGYMAVVHVCWDNEHRMTFKVYSADRAKAGRDQLLNECVAGDFPAFPAQPTMITALAYSGNTKSGNVSTVTPWAGISLRELMQCPAWWQLGYHERAAAFQRVAACVCRALPTMHTAVSGGCWSRAGGLWHALHEV